jgi:hypothetical protein
LASSEARATEVRFINFVDLIPFPFESKLNYLLALLLLKMSGDPDLGTLVI